MRFIRVTRDDGRTALVRPDAITLIYPNRAKVRTDRPAKAKPDEGTTIDVLDILVGTTVFHLINETEASLLSKMSQAAGVNIQHVVEAPDPQFAVEIPAEQQADLVAEAA